MINLQIYNLQKIYNYQFTNQSLVENCKLNLEYLL